MPLLRFEEGGCKECKSEYFFNLSSPTLFMFPVARNGKSLTLCGYSVVSQTRVLEASFPRLIIRLPAKS